MRIYKDNPAARIPAFATSGSACFDLQACLQGVEFVKAFTVRNEPTILQNEGNIIYIPRGYRALIPTGLIFDIPERHVLKVYPRSSTGLKKGLTLPNNVGIIDSDYVDPTYLLLLNISHISVPVMDGERLCQAELLQVHQYALEETLVKPKQKTDRNGGMGSTG